MQDDPPFAWQDRGDATHGDEAHGRPVGDDEDERPWRPTRVRDPVDDPEIFACGLDAVAARLPEAGVDGRLAAPSALRAHDYRLPATSLLRDRAVAPSRPRAWRGPWMSGPANIGPSPDGRQGRAVRPCEDMQKGRAKP